MLTLALLAAIEIVFFKFTAKNSNHQLLLKKYFFASIIALVILFLYAVPWVLNLIEHGYMFRDFTLHERMLTQIRILCCYIKWFFIPNVSELGLFHDDIILSSSIIDPISTFVCLNIIIVFISIAIFTYKKQPLILLGVIWYFVGHSLESTVLPLEMVYEHRNYFPSIGLLIVIFSISANLINSHNPSKNIIFSCLSVCLVAYYFVAHQRASQWTDNLTFSYYEALHHPTSPRSQYALGRLYANIALINDRKFDIKAIEHLERAAHLDKSVILPETSLLILTSKLNIPANPDWFASILHKLRSNVISSSDIIALDEMVKCSKKKCLLGTADMANIFEAAFASPNIELPTSHRATLLSIYANFLSNQLRDYKKTEIAMLEALKIQPKHTQHHINYIVLLIHTKRYDEASLQLMKLKQIDFLAEDNSKIKQLEKDLESKINERNINNV